MQVPFIKYIESLIVSRMNDAKIMQTLRELNLDFPEEGLTIVRDRFRNEKPSYFSFDEEFLLAILVIYWGVLMPATTSSPCALIKYSP